MIDVGELERFVVRAKRASYVGDGERALPSREGAHDLTFADGQWSYRDSYFGGTDFIGQEVVWLMGEPVWAMNYYGYIFRPDLIDAVRSGAFPCAVFVTVVHLIFRRGFVPRWLRRAGCPDRGRGSELRRLGHPHSRLFCNPCRASCPQSQVGSNSLRGRRSSE